MVDSPEQTQLQVGLDVGSTTVKAVVMDAASDAVVWRDYKRHETRQTETVVSFLERIEADLGTPRGGVQAFITGSGGSALAEHVGARFVQEVNAVALAVERFHPEAASVVELGGQDAKIIIWHDAQSVGQRRKSPSMNDKCAGGTGAVIDKVAAKLGLDMRQVAALDYSFEHIHPVAGKCGVFAETDINGLQKSGVAAPELMASLFDALVQQNLSVLARGHTLRPTVLLLGGPNTFIPALVAAWRRHIPALWQERGTALPPDVAHEDLIVVPPNAEYFAALGAVLFGRQEGARSAAYRGPAALSQYAEHGRSRLRKSSGVTGLVAGRQELTEFERTYALPPDEPKSFRAGETVEAWIGIDGGSTSTKGVLLDDEGRLLAKEYRLSQGNPIEDARLILHGLRAGVERHGARLVARGLGVTGYAKDILKDVFGADVALVETVAHAQSALHYHRDVDVIVDVGGQDIKVIMLHAGKVKDFRLNTQCSAGNGYFLQATASRFGHDVSEYAALAFTARQMPVFNYGCAVFLETDIVNFQQLGWSREEILAGLAAVLPKNIWLYVVQEPNLGKLGRRFILQGGTQKNLAAVKAQHDFIVQRVPDAEVIVHRYCGESGAIGAALEAMRVVAAPASQTRFVGFDTAACLSFATRRDETTRCVFCTNRCLRTFVETKTEDGAARRYIIATCEKGAAEEVADMREIKARIERVKAANPNFVEIAGREAFRARKVEFSPLPTPPWARFRPAARRRWHAHRREIERRTGELTIGIPRVLNLYSCAPFFRAYFIALGLPAGNIRFSSATSEAMWRAGSRRGSIDQCFPSKVALAHVHQLVFGRRPPTAIFFPAIASLPSELDWALDSCACPTAATTPAVVKAAFTKEDDVFAEHGIAYLDPVLSMAEPDLLERQMHAVAERLVGATRAESDRALEFAHRAAADFLTELRAGGRAALDHLEAEGGVGIVVLGRPYHNDPGLNHEIVDALQMCGYPIFTIESLPLDDDLLDRLFGDEVRAGAIRGPMDISDVWKNAYSENSNRKLWAAKVVARHPNLVALDLSSFKCGHDAPIYGAVEAIVEASGTPYFAFHDIDENKPSASIKIRVETIAYFLEQYKTGLGEAEAKEAAIRSAVAAYEASLRRGEEPAPVGPAVPATVGRAAPLQLSLRHAAARSPAGMDCGASGVSGSRVATGAGDGGEGGGCGSAG